MKFQALSAVSVLAATVSAHGYVDNITIAGTVYTVSIPSLEAHCIPNSKSNSALLLLPHPQKTYLHPPSSFSKKQFLTSKIGISTLPRPLHNPPPRPHRQSSPRQRPNPRLNSNRPPMRRLHRRRHLRFHPRETDRRSSSSRKQSITSLDPMAREPFGPSNNLHGEMHKG